MFGGYKLRMIIDRLAIFISVNKSTEMNRHVELTIDGVSCGMMIFPSYLDPSLSVGNYHIAIWCGLSLYIYDMTTFELRLLIQDDEVHEAYWIDGNLVLVREISLVLLSIPDVKELSHHDHDEIIVSSHWEGDILVVDDLEKYQARFQLEGNLLQQMSTWKLMV